MAIGYGYDPKTNTQTLNPAQKTAVQQYMSSSPSSLPIARTATKSPATPNPYSWEALLQQAGGLLNQPVTDPYSGQAQQWWSTVMAPDYQAYSPEQLEGMYGQQAGQLKEDVFSQWEDAMAGRLANQGLAGSGVARMDWENLLGKEGGALGKLRGDIWNYGQDATRQDVQQALASYPAWQQMNFQNQNVQWDKLMEMLGIMGNERANKQQQSAANAQGIATVIGSILGGLI